jgi:hypothetical protein
VAVKAKIRHFDVLCIVLGLLYFVVQKAVIGLCDVFIVPALESAISS